MAASLRGRLSRGTRMLSESEYVQQQLGEAAAEIESAILIMRTHRAQSVAFVDTGAEPPREWTMRNRRDIAFAASLLRRGVERLVDLGGARGVYDHEPVSQFWRDILTISTHAAVSRHLAMVPYGRALLGLPPLQGEA
jgi:two-component flavin-dependent monooxygenase